ncbi:MAG TPA: hypothetical protein VER17_05845 [Tepidisphaeraceae bacterium]|nr:hypothetical protein [Tepidisphaeraceae bacterium]
MNPHTDFALSRQVFWLLILAIPIACVARTVVYEEIFREPREWCKRNSQTRPSLVQRKFFYLFTCEYCFSHYVTLFFLLLTRFKLLIPDWRGYVLAFFALVFVANAYMNLYSRLRVDITSEKKDIERKEKEIQHKEKEIDLKGKEIEKLEHELSGVRVG